MHIPEIDINLDFIKVNTNTSFISLMVRQGMIKRAMVKMTTVKGVGGMYLEPKDTFCVGG